MPNSLFDPKLDFDRLNWVISVFSYGSGTGHSKIVVEGMIGDDDSHAKYFINEYDIISDPVEKYNGNYKYRVRTRNGEQWTYEQYQARLRPNISAVSPIEKEGLKAFYKTSFSRSKKMHLTEIKSVIDDIEKEKRLNDAYHDGRIKVMRHIVEKGRAILSKRSTNDEASSKMLKLMHDQKIFREVGRIDEVSVIERNITELLIPVGEAELKSTPDDVYQSLVTDLQKWVRENSYDPTYQLAVLSPADTVSNGINCAIWVNKKAKMVGLETSLPNSSGGSVPKLATSSWSGAGLFNFFTSSSSSDTSSSGRLLPRDLPESRP